MNGDTFNRRVQAFLAVAITIGFFSVIAALMLLGDLPPSVKDILLVMLGALLASYKELTGYFFGSSSGSAKKDDVIAAASVAAAAPALGTVPTGTPADPVSVTEAKP